MDQKRLLLAFVLSAIILFGWSYLFPPATPQQNANSPQTATNTTPTQAPTAQPTQETQQQNAAVANAAPDAVPQKSLTVSTPLYEVVLDSRGALVKSWIIKRNRDKDGDGKPLYSIASTKENPKRLELVSQKGFELGKDDPAKIQAPLKVVTGKPDLDALLASRNFQLSGDDAGELLELNGGERKSVEFTLTEPASGIEAHKKLTFDANSYTVKLETKVTQGGQPVPNTKVSVGPNIGDQGIPRFTYYSIAPEGVAAVGDESPTHMTAAQIEQDKQSPRVKIFNDAIQWAGVGDTYFAMTLIEPQPAPGLEFRTEKYEHQTGGEKEERHLITAYVPVPSDGSPTYLFAGPKDHDQLQLTSEQLSKDLGRQVDLGQLINYGWTSRVTRPLSTPILWSIKQLNKLTGNYGLAIILFTIVIYTLFFPLKWRSSKSMKKAQKLAPRMKELQEKIKGMKQSDPRLKELQMEQLRLMKEGNPLGGCLPLLIQMPFLIALYIAITISIDFRQSSFLWIQDLSAGDPTKVLPILMAGSMLVLQLITPAPSADPLQRKMMAVVMPLMMLYILWSAPAGLLVYWLVGNLVGFGQQMLINRMLKNSEDDQEQPPTEQAGSRPKKKLNNARLTQA